VSAKREGLREIIIRAFFPAAIFQLLDIKNIQGQKYPYSQKIITGH